MAFYKNLVEDYMRHLEIKEKLIADIKKRGLRYTVTNGNGIESEKPNESVQLLQKETVTMLKILSDKENIDVLINNAGINSYKLFQLTKMEEARNLFEVWQSLLMCNWVYNLLTFL